MCYQKTERLDIKRSQVPRRGDAPRTEPPTMSTTGTVISVTKMRATVRSGPVSAALPSLITLGKVVVADERSHVASTITGFHTDDSQKPTQTQPRSPMQNCDAFVRPSIESLKTLARQSVQALSVDSQYVVFVDGKTLRTERVSELLRR